VNPLLLGIKFTQGILPNRKMSMEFKVKIQYLMMGKFYNLWPYTQELIGVMSFPKAQLKDLSTKLKIISILKKLSDILGETQV